MDAKQAAEAAAMLRGAVEIYRSNPTLAKEIPKMPPVAAAVVSAGPNGGGTACAAANVAVAK